MLVFHKEKIAFLRTFIPIVTPEKKKSKRSMKRIQHKNKSLVISTVQISQNVKRTPKTSLSSRKSKTGKLRSRMRFPGTADRSV